MLVQPLDCLPMLITCSFHYPNDHRGIFAGCIGDNLAKMVVVCVLKLVFDDYSTSGSFFGCVQVYAETTDGRFQLFQHNIYTYGIAQKGKVFFLCQPL